MKIVLIQLLVLVSLFISGCGSVDKKVDLRYERLGGLKGGAGELYIARPVERHDIAKKPSGAFILGRIKGTEADIVTEDSISDWVMSALSEELTFAGYHVKVVPELPESPPKGIKVVIFKVIAEQEAGLVTIKSTTDLKISFELWKGKRNVRNLSVETGAEEKGMDRSSEPINTALKKALQNAVQKAVPDIIKALEGQ